MARQYSENKIDEGKKERIGIWSSCQSFKQAHKNPAIGREINAAAHNAVKAQSWCDQFEAIISARSK